MSAWRKWLCLSLFAVFILGRAAVASAAPLSDAEITTMLKGIDERFRLPPNFTRQVYGEQKRKNYPDRIYEVVVYRSGDKMTIVYTKPKTEAGKAFLRADANLWLYDPAIGQWDRRTKREYIQVGDVRARDFDDWNLAKEYDATYVGEETIAKFQVHHLKLKAKKDVEVGEPMLDFWIDKASGNPLKMETFTEQGRPLRAVFYTGYGRIKYEGKETFYIKEFRVVDHIEADRQTFLKSLALDSSPVDQAVFTKAWVESKSR